MKTMCIVQMKAAGYSVDNIMSVTGHKNSKTVSRYLKIRTDYELHEYSQTLSVAVGSKQSKKVHVLKEDDTASTSTTI